MNPNIRTFDEAFKEQLDRPTLTENLRKSCFLSKKPFVKGDKILFVEVPIELLDKVMSKTVVEKEKEKGTTHFLIGVREDILKAQIGRAHV